MLVFQKDFFHIEERTNERAHIIAKQIIEIIADINLYLPDDWRMTRTKNNFAIEVVTNNNFTFRGNSFRMDNGDILNIISTVYFAHWADLEDSRVILDKHCINVNKHDKKKSPDIIVPNLYYWPAIADNSSPLFARQYEKIKVGLDGKQLGDQYHRIHPLFRGGLDSEHFHWIKWNINGHVEPVEFVDTTYHGKDYWEIGSLDGTAGRGKASGYIHLYHAKCVEHGIVHPSPPVNSDVPYEAEYKFLVPGGQEEYDAILEIIASYNSKNTGISVPSIGKPKVQKDTYYDDENGTLYATGISFRTRMKSKENIRVTVKKRFPYIEGYSREGLYTRIEEEATASPAQIDSLRKGHSINLWPYRLLSYIAPTLDKKSFKEKVKVTNKRTVVTLVDSNKRKAELCLDLVEYNINGIRQLYFEIELEGKGMPPEIIANFASKLERDLGLIISEQTKYERGVSLKKMAGTGKEKELVIIDTDCGVDDALALILALKAPELEVVAVTTVAGNTREENVLTNVFKVLNTLKIDKNRRPIIARGASETRKAATEQKKSGHGDDAECVHCKDGLGDIIEILSSDCKPVDERPAWKLICDLANKYPNSITLITLGPMTNSALAIKNEPESVKNLKRIVSMGGVFFEVGNIGADAEFNIKFDPESAKDVVEFCRNTLRKPPVLKDTKTSVHLPDTPSETDYLNIINAYNKRNGTHFVLTDWHKVVDYIEKQDHINAVPLVFVGLDVTHKVILRKPILERAIAAHPNNNLLKFIRNISNKYMEFYNNNEGLPGCYLHDPLAVAYVINPAFLEVEEHIVNVETQGAFTNGVIFPDDRPTRNPVWRNRAEEVIGIARNVRREAFEEYLFNMLLK